MLYTTNITNTEYDLRRFDTGDDMRAFCRELRLDGFELMPFGENSLKTIPAGLVRGVHLSFFSCWVDYWNGNERGVRDEFGDMETARARFGGGRDAIIDAYSAQLDWAEELGAEYVVFHVSDVSLREIVSYRFLHTDEEVIRATLELLRTVLTGKTYSFAFLVENLWWPGFTFTRPDITNTLLDGIPYANKGVMLDTGHLLHTNLDLTSQESGVEYILETLHRHGDAKRFVRGVHLNQSASGAHVREMLAHPPALSGDYAARYGDVYESILGIDRHMPFTCKGVREMLMEIAPEFVTFEFITDGSAQHEAFIRAQNAALGR